VQPVLELKLKPRICIAAGSCIVDSEKPILYICVYMYLIVTKRLSCTVSDIIKFLVSPKCSDGVFSTTGNLQVIFNCGFGKGDSKFIFMFHCHFVSVLNCLEVILLCLFGWDFSICHFWGYFFRGFLLIVV